MTVEIEDTSCCMISGELNYESITTIYILL